MTLPSQVNKTLAAAAVDDFFNREKWQKVSRDYGWVYNMVDPLTVIVSLSAGSLNETRESFVVRLSCDYYPTHPPDAIFVNPASWRYEPGNDHQHVAKLTAPYCHTHLAYDYKNEYKYGPQLVCSSMTLGYYFSNHSPTLDQAWDPTRHDLGSTVYTIHRALNSPHFQGRHT